MRRFTLFFVALLSLMTPAFAQNLGAIAGVVKDQSGAVVPGADVEITSPAMIEGRRSTKTGGNGEYRFVDLRPGMYTVVVKQQGFETLKQENVNVGASFTVTVNAQLTLGQAAQEVTVDAAPPMVDVQNSLAEKEMDRATLDTIPTGRDPFAVGQTIPGVTTST